MLDFVIIGGGIAGISAAARLSEHGSALVLERETHLAYHTSGRSAALYEKNYGSPSTIALAKAARGEWNDLLSGVLSPRGFMLVCLRGEEAQFETDRRHMRLTELTMAEAKALVPILKTDEVMRAAISTTAQDIDTDMMLQRFVRLLHTNGGQIETNQTVQAITKISDGWQIDTNKGQFTACKVINAAGAWGDEIAKLAGIPKIGLTPMRRSVARLAAPGGLDVQSWPMLFGPGERWYAKADAGALIVSLAEETPSPPMDAWAHDIDLAEALARYQDYVTEPVTRPISSWAGLRTFAPDRNLVLGPAPQDDSFVWVVGQGGYGFFTAPAASQFVADITLGQASTLSADIMAQLSPWRFS
jgi:D-arginine dehydrogenase